MGNISWQAKPIKQHNATSWLRCSASAPPATTLTLNDHFVLIKEINKDFERPQSVIKAGRCTAITKHEPKGTGTDPFQVHDPWQRAATGPVASSSTVDNKVGQHTKQIQQIEERLDRLQRQQETTQNETKAEFKAVRNLPRKCKDCR